MIHYGHRLCGYCRYRSSQFQGQFQAATGMTNLQRVLHYTYRPDGNEGCWFWHGARGQGGMSVHLKDSTQGSPRKFLYEEHHQKKLLKSSRLRSICEKQDCINPRHMETNDRDGAIREGIRWINENGTLPLCKEWKKAGWPMALIYRNFTSWKEFLSILVATPQGLNLELPRLHNEPLDLNDTLDAIEAKELTANQAAIEFGCSISTIYKHLRKRKATNLAS